MRTFRIAQWSPGRLAVTAAVVAAITIAFGLTSHAQLPSASVTVYKSPTCGCCAKWVDHMRANGFDVTAQNVEDMAAVKQKYGVPAQAGSCHTSLVGGYVLEGHVPADVVKRLLAERPAVVGVGVPGMPVGSPGMEVPGGRRDPYTIVTFDRSGQLKVYERR